MNNQMPYGFVPQYNMNQNNEIRVLTERVEVLEKKVAKLAKKVAKLDNNNNYPTPYNNFNTQEFPNNYMI